MRTGAIGALAASLVLCATGCGTRTESPDPGRPATPERKTPADPSAAIPITVEVKGMTKALGIT